jgi:tRNA G18 (ribose-2'-O)-methylase SpoU
MTLYTGEMDKEIIVIAHNIRSCHNIGALLRTCDGIGVKKVHLTGYTPYPITVDDSRLPHLASKINKQISKTALGAEKSVDWDYNPDLSVPIQNLEKEGYCLSVLEQSNTSTPLPSFEVPDKIALLLGSEVSGVDSKLLKHIPLHLEIPMYGSKESFNVVEAASMALYKFRFG